MDQTLINPYELLQRYDMEARQTHRDLPRKIGSPWLGIELKIAGTPCLTPLKGIIEIFKAKSLTRVPASVPWLLGVANLRGRLVPVTDIEYWLTGVKPLVTRPRILVIEEASHCFGFYFAEVVGLQRLLSAEIQSEKSAVPSFLEPFVHQFLHYQDKSVPLIDFSRILSQDGFYQTAEAS